NLVELAVLPQQPVAGSGLQPVQYRLLALVVAKRRDGRLVDIGAGQETVRILLVDELDVESAHAPPLRASMWRRIRTISGMPSRIISSTGALPSKPWLARFGHS